MRGATGQSGTPGRDGSSWRSWRGQKDKKTRSQGCHRLPLKGICKPQRSQMHSWTPGELGYICTAGTNDTITRDTRYTRSPSPPGDKGATGSPSSPGSWGNYGSDAIPTVFLRPYPTNHQTISRKRVFWQSNENRFERASLSKIWRCKKSTPWVTLPPNGHLKWLLENNRPWWTETDRFYQQKLRWLIRKLKNK